MTWLSAHVFYYDSPDRLLVDCVAPLVARAKRETLAHQAFFLRYWLGGPHVRLRLRVCDESALDSLKRIVSQQMGDYLAAHPSDTSLDPELLDGWQDRLRALEPGAEHAAITPNNTIEFVEYRPEVDKYGGAAGVAVAEWLFDRSSDVALSLLAQPNDSPTRRLGTGFAAFALALHAFALPSAQVRSFLSGYVAIWRDFLPRPVDQMAHQWEAEALPLRAQLAAVAHARFGGAAPAGPLADWHAALVEARDRLLALAVRGELSGAAAPGEPAKALRPLLAHYIHTFNNRLGILPAEEARLAHLLGCAVGGLP